MALSKNQPVDGETLLACRHAFDGHPSRIHWLTVDPCASGRVESGTGWVEMTSRWIVLCDACFSRYDDPCDAISRYVTWSGTDPIVMESVQ
jgi:hypothetical protein